MKITLSQHRMYKWVTSYPVISEIADAEWLTPDELDAAFKRLVESKNIGAVLRINFPGLRKSPDGRWEYDEEATT